MHLSLCVILDPAKVLGGKYVKVIVGLGNPGMKYAKTRHNLGFWVVDLLSERWQMPLTKHKFKAKYAEGVIRGERAILVKPQTFMNRSGESIGDLMRFYQPALENLLVIYDDLDLIPGLIRIKRSGSAGGHNGMGNIINHLKSQEFPRLRVGIGQTPPFMDTADYVLQGFDQSEIKIVQEACLNAANAAEMWLSEDIVSVMNHYNKKQTNSKT